MLYWLVVLLDQVVQILILTNLDVSSFVIVIVIDGGGVGSAFVNIDFYRFIIQLDRFTEKTLGGFPIGQRRAINSRRKEKIVCTFLRTQGKATSSPSQPSGTLYRT